ncbi:MULTISPECIES: lysophospholipid acyltransferase family protein [Gammaproteobacteria]|uniref:lysophospholipid acyltransferase family protein n=1 Tax=Gammaproteobacteria TaxID=1236 RepID=UPI001ADA689D|nr:MULTISPECIES: lysophospholipid acyltransferase family protein [Gammaproteobacteria]MBO9483270.1 lysophospholipid acyltransferase family protein [Salinisphaera sp. G21_0]MBO9496144.1 lysophospholipid acyltransferase family protein [Thalassotalea sp. G20_0]
MRHTIFDTPIVNSCFRFLSHLGLKLFGWKLEGQRPNARKYVIIAAPHTSNWDFILIIACAFCFRINIYWMGKNSLFKGPFGGIMTWLGGIPVDRSKANGLVQQMVDTFHNSTDLAVAIPPEGTRNKVRQWKSGFYHVAHGAEVPIALSFLDYKKKVGGFGPMFFTTGDYASDLKKIQEFYQPMTGKNPEKFA